VERIVVGEGATYEEAVADVKPAVQFHMESLGAEVIWPEQPIAVSVDEVTI
jgi:hypothetical protein